MARKKKDAANLGINVHTEVNPKTSIKMTDVAGLGALGKTAAGQEIARTIGSAVADAIRLTSVAFLGTRAAHAEAQRLVTLATAEAEARSITAENRATLRARAGERVIADEMRRQAYIDSATVAAIEYADTREHENYRKLDEDFALEWIDGVKNAHSNQVRDIYSQILASQTNSNVTHIKGPSLALLKNLDGSLAKAFGDFVAQYITYGVYPYMKAAKPRGQFAPSDYDLDYLREIGFVIDSTFDGFQIWNLNIQINSNGMTMLHSGLSFTRRSFDIANAIYDHDPSKEPLSSRPISDDEKIQTIVDCCLGCCASGRIGVSISIFTDDEEIRIIGTEKNDRRRLDEVIGTTMLSKLNDVEKAALHRLADEYLSFILSS